MAKHIIQGKLNPCSWAMVTHICLRMNYLFPLELFNIDNAII